MTIQRAENRIVFTGPFGIGDVHRPFASIHDAIESRGYGDICLDFSECTAAFAGPMLGLCAQVMKLREAGIEAQLRLPINSDLERLFHNANWAHLLDPKNYRPSKFRGHTQVAATHFVNPDDQNRAVNRIVNAILGAIQDIDRSDFAALEWSINELTDNVIVHSRSPVGGLVQVSTFQRNRKRVEFIVADAGAGIPATLREGHPEIESDLDALDQSIREGVTRDKSVGQGNGLFGSYQICSHSGGMFQVDSGRAKLSFNPMKGLSVSNERTPYEGTLVIAQIDFSIPHLLEEALRFAGNLHTPVDYVETKYEQYESEDLVVTMLEESKSFGSRTAGTPIRNRIMNLVRMCPAQRIVIDFSGIPLVSSSFADEVFGKMFVLLGPMAFMQRLTFRNTESTVRSLIDRAISQRVATGLEK